MDGLNNVFSYFVAADADVRPNNRREVSCGDAVLFCEPLHGSLNNPFRCTAPSGVDCGNAASSRAGNQDWNTVRRLDPEKHTGNISDGCVTFERLIGRRCVIHVTYDPGMHLFQSQNRPTRRADCCKKSDPIEPDDRVGRGEGCEAKIVALAASRRKSVHDPWHRVQYLGADESYLVLAFYL